MKLNDIKKCNTVKDLEDLDIGTFAYEVNYRGGALGFRGSEVAGAIGVCEHLLPRNFGAWVNYLGGGIRGAICTSNYSPEITGRKKALLDALIDACKRAYKSAEDEMNLNAEEDEDGETNWDAVATNATRRAGVKSYPGL